MIIDEFAAQGETDPRAFAGGLGCKEVVEYFAPKVVRNAGTTVGKAMMTMSFSHAVSTSIVGVKWRSRSSAYLRAHHTHLPGCW